MNIEEALSIIPRCLLSIIVLFLITKLIGKKQVSELSLFDYVIGISIGNFTAEMTMNFDNQYINGVVAIITFGLFAYLINILCLKSIILRRLFFQTPTIIMENGNILKKELKKCKIDINDLLEQARISGYFDLDEISYAIMEANGKLTFMPKDKYKQLVKDDLNIKTNPDNLNANIIIDGKYMLNNIKNTNKTIDYYKRELKIKGYAKVENIVLCTYKNNNIKVYEKVENKSKKILE